MGAMADAFVAYAQPLIDDTDGSLEQMNEALALGQLCYNLALLPEESRATTLSEMRSSAGMNDAEFEKFNRATIQPMIRRHEEMFPQMHRGGPSDTWRSASPRLGHPKPAEPAEAYAGTDRYAPCPCGSGEKYKFCCGKKRR